MELHLEFMLNAEFKREIINFGKYILNQLKKLREK